MISNSGKTHCLPLPRNPPLIDTPDGPKEQLRRVGITTDAWVTQIYQGEPGGDGSKTWAYGGKVDGFLKIDAEKLGLWSGLHVNVQYEHYFGENINRRDFALIPVNTAQAYLGEGTFHSALSVSVTQDLSEGFFGQRRQVQHDDAGVANAADRRRRHRHLHQPSARAAVERRRQYRRARRLRQQGR